jgi:hypothetical protein
MMLALMPLYSASQVAMALVSIACSVLKADQIV